jgi:hypothetical protein
VFSRSLEYSHVRGRPPKFREIFRSPGSACETRVSARLTQADKSLVATDGRATDRVGGDVFSQRHGIGTIAAAVEPGVVVATVVVAIPAAVVVGKALPRADGLCEFRRRCERHQNGCGGRQDHKLGHHCFSRLIHHGLPHVAMSCPLPTKLLFSVVTRSCYRTR